jgi:hypothetical protein
VFKYLDIKKGNNSDVITLLCDELIERLTAPLFILV